MQVDRLVAIVTGGGRGIGEATARALASDGAAVVVVARTRTEIEQVAAEIQHAGGAALPLAADIGSEGSANKIARTAEEQFGKPCQILVNAAGITGPVAELADVEVASVRRVLEIHLLGALSLSQAVLPGMKRQGWGRIVNVTSGLSRRVQPGLGAYSTAKAALLHLSRIMDAESRQHGVRVFALEPGIVRSQMNQELRSLAPTGVRAGVVQMLRDMERDPGLVEATESARLIRLAATGQADDLAGAAVSIYDSRIRARLAAAG
jgi:NAD(P)-dependent dehydrogenase (short-subunit alcohol dehydrogenase family)